MLGPNLSMIRLFLHVLAATIWVGGQIVLAGAVPALRAKGLDMAPRIVAKAYARLAWPAFGVLVLTGMWNLVEVDVTDTTQLETLPARVREVAGLSGSDGLDGVLHSIGFAPPAAFNFMDATWADVSTALHTSAYSLKSLAQAALPLLKEKGSVVGLTFDAKFAWPVYDWMGVAKAAFESTNRYLARDLGRQKGIRCNLVAAGPIRTTAAKSIPGFEAFENTWDNRAPLGWDVNDPEPAALACVALLSDLFPATTGEIVHVDGGVHAMGQ
mgnify:CR=1 FL=1